MTNNIPELPESGEWSREFLKILTKYVNTEVQNPALSREKHKLVYDQLTNEEDELAWRLARPYERVVQEAHDLETQNRTPETYVNARLASRRFTWVERFFNQLVLDQRG